MKKNKGIILAGGLGTRLRPITKVISKQLIPIYDKPMIYYPISVLKKCNINDILIISDKINIKLFKKLLGDGKDVRVNLSYKIQNKPNGIPEAFLIGSKFVGNNDVVLILGDNIIYEKKNSFAKEAIDNLKKGYSTIFAYKVKNPSSYGVVSLDNNGEINSIIEKPNHPKSNLAVIGLYFFSNEVINKAKKLKRSSRGEFEIVDLIKIFLNLKKLKLIILDTKLKWFDTGTFKNILEASKFIASTKSK